LLKPRNYAVLSSDEHIVYFKLFLPKRNLGFEIGLRVAEYDFISLNQT